MTPLVGITATRGTRSAYSETGLAGVVDDPFSYGSFSANEVTGTLGLGLTGPLWPKLNYQIGVRAEHDLSYKIDTFSLTGTFGTSTYQSTIAPSSTRVVGLAGLFYALAPNQNLFANGYVSEIDSNSAPSYALTVGFKVGF